MIEIVPAINVADFTEVVRRIRIAEHVARTVHIDVADGTFTPQAMWHRAEDLKNFQTPLAVEIHLMITSPEEKIAAWFLPAVSRIIFHVEAARDSGKLIESCHAAKKQAGVAIRPDTSWELLLPFARSADLLQTLAVNPGPSGQTFDPQTLEKIKNLRTTAPDAVIEVDGGLGAPGVARACRDAGATLLVEGAALFGDGVVFNEAFSRLEQDVA